MIDRRTLLIGGGAGVGLVVAWALWPRAYEPNLRTAEGETGFNAFLKIARDGRVIVVVPQTELGQGVTTSLPQIVADELGADWRTVAVEPAPLSPLYANELLAEEVADGRLPSALQGIGQWAAREVATRSALMMTGGSSSVRAFEPRLREAGAAGRVLLEMAAADRWDVSWELLDTREGFVWNGNQRIRFGELAEAAAGLTPPEILPLRGGIEGRLAGESLPRLDLPAKVDGSAPFAGDIRLRDMVFASVRAGPIGDSRLVTVDKDAADAVPGVLAVFEMEDWAGAAATNWWAANRAVEAMKPVFETRGDLIEDAMIVASLDAALESDGERLVEVGDPDAVLSAGDRYRAHYLAGPAPNAPIEPLTATARALGDAVEVWAPVQAPGLARAAAARAAGVPESRVTLYPTLAGGGYGRKFETKAIEQAVAMAVQLKRPVQLTWSRIEETMRDTVRPPAQAEMVARLGPGGRIEGWRARIAAPSATAAVIGRLRGERAESGLADGSAVAGAVPPYAIPAVAVEHLPADVGLNVGLWRSGAHAYTSFFTESFVDELARQAGVEPLSFRMQMLEGNPRLARVLSTAAALGGWDGGASGSAMGLACHSAYGSHAAIVVEIAIDKSQKIAVRRAVCAVDCGRIVNPDIVRQQLEGGIMHGISAATAAPLRIADGLVSAWGFRDLGLPRLADTPEMMVEIIPSTEDPGGVTELAVPPVAPAIANALHALTGRRVRNLPLTMA